MIHGQVRDCFSPNLFPVLSSFSPKHTPVVDFGQFGNHLKSGSENMMLAVSFSQLIVCLQTDKEPFELIFYLSDTIKSIKIDK
jgi:hypothetical protein